MPSLLFVYRLAGVRKEERKKVQMETDGVGLQGSERLILSSFASFLNNIMIFICKIYRVCVMSFFLLVALYLVR